MTIALLRVKNEARWIQRCIRSILPLCDQVVVFDDHSTDRTPWLAALCGDRVTIVPSPFEGLDECRDKNWLLDQHRAADWIVWIDGDEEIAIADRAKLADCMRTTTHACISLKVKYLWDRPDQMRVDGVYGDFRRQSVFRPRTERFVSGPAPGFHCGNVPRSLWVSCAYPDVSLLHYGYMDAADRVRKYEWYRTVDPNNDHEDGYRHIVIGDIFDPAVKTRHAGPLKLAPL